MLIQMNKKGKPISQENKDIVKDLREIRNAKKNSDILRVQVDVSPKAYLTFFGVLAAIYLVIKLAPVFFILFLSYAIATVLGRLVRKLTRHSWPMWLAILTVYLSSFVVLTAVVVLIVYPVANELSNVSQINQYFTGQLNALDNLGAHVFKASWPTIRQSVLKDFKGFELFTNAGVQTIRNMFKLFSSLVAIVTALILSIYIVVDHDTFVDMLLLQITNDEKRRTVIKLINDVEEKLYLWVRGQGILSTIIGFLVWLLLTILGIPFALPLALLAGLLESVPNLGPVLSAIPAILLAFAVKSPLVALFTALGFIVIQQIENNLIVPHIMSDVVGVKPLVVIIGILVGLQIGGIIGALIAVPVLVLLKLVLEFYKDLQRLKAKNLI